ncbi:hypothetical protein MLD38_017838 [Melastoma candidum]|uniref:Uncharacterized protein n=1 Tax=Melastoma candidum TaxID=119954 RepID=A0ACB9QV19_9MYRT|nr:hypothetical protein MLD38_017838 [Melastoma candidum]
MAMARASSGLAYPERFYAAASYSGFDGSSAVTSKFSNDVALLLYALHQQATVGPCNISKPRGWSPVEQSKWASWHGLGNMASTEAMRLFVKILEEEDPGWYSRVPNGVAEPVTDVEVNTITKVDPIVENGIYAPETKSVYTENGIPSETQDKDVVSEGLGLVAVYDQWIGPSVSGQKPKPRYEHGAAVIGDKMYMYAGNHNGRYLGDIHMLDLRSWSWSKIETKQQDKTTESQSSRSSTACAGHSLIAWGNKLLSIAGHTKDPSDAIQVRELDLLTNIWSTVKTYGKPPVSRGGQSATLVGSTLVIFGGQDAKRALLNDLHILDLETMTWDEFDAVGVPPSPRSDHAAAVHAERYLLIFGGGSHASCFNDLHVLDLQTMEWSRPIQQGQIPTPRAGHAGVTVGENWFIVGGGNNKSGVSETVVLNMSTLVWSVVTTVEGRVPVASEGLSLVVGSYDGEDILVTFGGYNGRYNNEVNVLKPSHKSTLPAKSLEAVPDSVSAMVNPTNATRDVESELEAVQDGIIREITVDDVDQGLKPLRNSKPKGSGGILGTLKAEKEELESLLSKERLTSVKLKQDLSEAEARNTDLYEELQSVRGQLAAEQSRCFKLEVDVAELRQKLQTMESMQKELELLQRQKAASEQAEMMARQRQKNSGGMWTWITGSPPGQTKEEI